jgi:Holliday junction resolvase RusA-like endonuclease
VTAAAITYHSIHLTAYGTPIPQGSKKAFAVAGRGRLLDVNRDQLHTWRDDVKQAALAAMEETPTWDRDTLGVLGAFTFTFKRPNHHYVAGDPTRELKDRAPRLHTKTPDLDKLLRSTWDALTASGVIRDDCLIAQTFATKVYLDPMGYRDLDRPGVKIALTAVRP